MFFLEKWFLKCCKENSIQIYIFRCWSIVQFVVNICKTFKKFTKNNETSSDNPFKKIVFSAVFCLVFFFLIFMFDWTSSLNSGFAFSWQCLFSEKFQRFSWKLSHQNFIKLDKIWINVKRLRCRSLVFRLK